MSIKALTDLQGLKESNVAELEQIGITSVSELRDALNDPAKVKEMIKGLSGVGPKTVENWKTSLSETEAKSEPKTKPEAKVEIEEDAEISEGVEGYRVKIKPEISGETADALAKRAIISGNRPAFKRQEWFRYSKLGDKWRKPKGIHSKMKRQLKRRTPMVDIGYGGPAAVRGLHPSGFREVIVHNPDALEAIDPKVQAVRIGRTVGFKKRTEIEKRAAELGIRVLNRMV
ncbi:MAG: 50S ribosomal protein L32e [Candidatus Methanoplasma sp.]|jgi:large subunit ribosomal protein L32e|nr:50S ribosomal protein L32e [Candidatus Methanoplasma sp.]